VYAIVRSGGRQHKVAVGDVLEVDRLEGAVGSNLTLTPLLLVDGDAVKNKTGYRKRQGHRQRYTKIKVTDIKG
jgi:large subunit ribosomal protein L21